MSTSGSTRSSSTSTSRTTRSTPTRETRSSTTPSCSRSAAPPAAPGRQRRRRRNPPLLDVPGRPQDQTERRGRGPSGHRRRGTLRHRLCGHLRRAGRRGEVPDARRLWWVATRSPRKARRSCTTRCANAASSPSSAPASTTSRSTKTVTSRPRSTRTAIATSATSPASPIGLNFNTELVEDTSLETENGIVVDEFMRTNVDNVFAAGDITTFNDLVLGEQAKNGSWGVGQATGNDRRSQHARVRQRGVRVGLLVLDHSLRLPVPLLRPSDARRRLYRGDHRRGRVAPRGSQRRESRRRRAHRRPLAAVGVQTAHARGPRRERPAGPPDGAGFSVDDLAAATEQQ